MSIAHRRVALRLHALRAADRHWVLSRVVESDRSQIESYLQELQSFRIDDPVFLANSGLAGLSAVSQGGVEKTGKVPDHIVNQVLAVEPAWVTDVLFDDAPPNANGLTYKAQKALHAAYQKRVSLLLQKQGPQLTSHAVPSTSRARALIKTLNKVGLPWRP